MKPKGLLIAVALMVVLGAAVWWSNKKQAAKALTPDSSLKLLTIPDAEISQVLIKNVAGDVITLKRENGKWNLTAPTPMAADADAVSAVTTALALLNAEKVVEEKTTDLHSFGLDVPTLDVTVTGAKGQTEELLIGAPTLDDAGYYAKLAKSPRVVTIPNAVKTVLEKRPEDLRDKRLLSFNVDAVTSVEVTAGTSQMQFTKNAQGDWQIVKPRPLRADSSQISLLVEKLRDAKMDVTESPEAAAKAFAAAPKAATVTVTTPAGSQTLEFHKKEHMFYAKSSALGAAYLTTPDVGNLAAQGLDSYRNKKLFDFGFSDPNKVELKSATYEKSGDKWLSGGKAMDNAAVQTLIDRLREITATKIVEKGAGETVFTAAVTSDGGKRVERVSILKQGAQYFAKRDDEPSIYQLEAKQVDDLQGSASGVKEAPPEQPKKK